MASKIRYRHHMITLAQLKKKLGMRKAMKTWKKHKGLFRGFAKGSVRTVKRGKTRILIGCPREKWSKRNKRCRVGTRGIEKIKNPWIETPRLFDKIRVGDRVTIRTPQGQKRIGRAVMRGPAGWVLNMGGRYGIPGIADDRNVVSVRKSR